MQVYCFNALSLTMFCFCNCIDELQMISTSILLFICGSINIKGNEPFLEDGSQTVLHVESLGHALHVFINGKLAGQTSEFFFPCFDLSNYSSISKLTVYECRNYVFLAIHAHTFFFSICVWEWLMISFVDFPFTWLF